MTDRTATSARLWRLCATFWWKKFCENSFRAAEGKGENYERARADFWQERYGLLEEKFCEMEQTARRIAADRDTEEKNSFRAAADERLARHKLDLAHAEINHLKENNKHLAEMCERMKLTAPPWK